MKKIITLFLVIFLFNSAWGQSWCGNSFITVNGTWYTGSNSYVQPAGLFQGANIGSFSTNFILGGELQVWPSLSSPATLYYSIDSGNFTAITLPNNGAVGNNSKHYGESTISVTGLTNGSHSVAIYFQAGSAAVYDNNSSANFVASFTKTALTGFSQNLESSLSIFAQNGEIKAIFNGTAQINLYSVTGQLIRSVSATNQFNQSVKSGVYLLRINGQSHKVLVQ